VAMDSSDPLAIALLGVSLDLLDRAVSRAAYADGD
jgi:hypothetical protein